MTASIASGVTTGRPGGTAEQDVTTLRMLRRARDRIDRGGAGHLVARPSPCGPWPPCSGQYPAGMALAEVPPDPDMCVHLCPGLGAGAVDAFGVGLAALAEVLPDEEVVDEVVDDACDACVPDVELVEALAIVSPNASVAPSMAAPAAVPMRGLVILTRFSFLGAGPGERRPRSGPAGRQSPVGQSQLTGPCGVLLSQR